MKKAILTIIFITYLLSGFSQQINGEIISSVSEDGFQVVKVWGTHEERGYAVGFLLADNIEDLFDNYLLPAFGSYYNIGRSIMMSNEHISIDSVYIYEAMAMAEGINASGQMSMEVDYIDVLLANSFLDLENFLGKGLGLENGCSSLISWGTATEGSELGGKSVISRHLDWSYQQVIIRNQVMVIHIPSEENEQPWLLIGFAGQMSVLSGLNASGVAVMQHMLSDNYASAALSMGYEPVWFTLRKAIENNDYNGDGVNNTLDINSAINENISGYADSYIITGVAPSTFGEDDKIATIVEVTPNAPYLTFRNADFEDAIPNKNLYAANSTIARNNAYNYCQRYDSVMAHIGDGTNIGGHENWNIMLDYSSSCAFNGPGNIQFMQFIPENHYLKLAYHTIDGTQACENTPVIYDTEVLFEMPSHNDVAKKSIAQIKVNETENTLYISLPLNLQEDVLKVYNQKGELIWNLRVTNGYNVLNFSDAPFGLYIFHLSASDYTFKTILRQK